MVVKRLKLPKFFDCLAQTFPKHKHIDVARGGQRGHGPPKIFRKYSHFVL